MRSDHRRCEICSRLVYVGPDSDNFNGRLDWPTHRTCAEAAQQKVHADGFVTYDDILRIIKLARQVEQGTTSPEGIDLQGWIAALVRTARYSERRNGTYAAKALWIIDNRAWDVPLREFTGQGARRTLGYHGRR